MTIVHADLSRVTIPVHLLQYIDQGCIKAQGDHTAAEAFNQAMREAFPDGPPGGCGGFIDMDDPTRLADHLQARWDAHWDGHVSQYGPCHSCEAPHSACCDDPAQLCCGNCGHWCVCQRCVAAAAAADAAPLPPHPLPPF